MHHLPTLAPRPVTPEAPTEPSPTPLVVTHHSHAEWAAAFPHIERLYVRQKWKLRAVMAYMENELRFKASEQMYKKRFARWGFQKNNRSTVSAARQRLGKPQPRASGGSPSGAPPRTESKNRPTITDALEPWLMVPAAAPALGPSDTLMLLLMTSVRDLAVSVLENPIGARPTGRIVQRQQQQQQHKTKLSADGSHEQGLLPGKQPDAADISATFKLVIRLLRRGHGLLAGRVARKAFLMAESVLDLEGPVLVWNLLELMYSIASTPHVQLFHMLLAHLTALSGRRRFPPSHPLLIMLHALRKVDVVEPTSSPGRDTPAATSSGSSPSSSNESSSTRPEWGNPEDHALPTLLQRLWILNAELLFRTFDVRRLQLSFRLMWSECSVGMPASILHGAEHWLAEVQAQQGGAIGAVLGSITADADWADSVPDYRPTDDDDEILNRLLAPIRGPQLHNFDRLREDTGTALQGLRRSLSAADPDGRLTAARVMAGLLKWTILDGWSAGGHHRSVAEGDAPLRGVSGSDHGPAPAAIPRLHAHIVAYGLKTLVDHDLLRGAHIGPALDRTRAILALREYSSGRSNPQVVSELCTVQNLLFASGQVDEAREVDAEACRRLEEFVKDIPVDAP